MDNTEGTLTVQNSTVAKNASAVKGGGILNTDGTVTLDFTTLSGNTGGGLANYLESGEPAITVTNSILANDAGGECIILGGTVTTANTLATDETCGAPFLLADPVLGPLQINGGPTMTMAISADSPALDQTACDTAAADQRGETRPYGAACDLGAYEWQGEPAPEN